MSFDHHVDNLALKSPKITVNCDFEKSMLLSISSKFNSDSILLYLGELYITVRYPFLLCIFTSQIRDSIKDAMSTGCTAKNSS